ncbi:MAG: hypothetical protein H6R25_2606 [Proteobacteria bacterium]|nr:hypothetical protein [Pseudomonadota bacterium]
MCAQRSASGDWVDFRREQEDAEAMNLVGIALRGPKKAIDKVIKSLALHP